MLRRLPQIVLVLAVALGVATAALADPPPPPQPPAPMTGETFMGDDEETSVSGSCENRTIHYSLSSGIAVGPYPGTAIENGTIKLGAPLPGTPFHIVEELHATFKVSEERPVDDFVVEIVTLVEGRKDFVRQATDTGFAVAICDSRAPGFKVGVEESTVDATYEAFIHTDEGIFRDEGTTALEARDCRFNLNVGACENPAGSDALESFFEETFVSTLEEPELVVSPPGRSATVQEGKGCGDRNHLHEREAECKP